MPHFIVLTCIHGSVARRCRSRRSPPSPSPSPTLSLASDSTFTPEVTTAHYIIPSSPHARKLPRFSVRQEHSNSNTLKSRKPPRCTVPATRNPQSAIRNHGRRTPPVQVNVSVLEENVSCHSALSLHLSSGSPGVPRWWPHV